MSLANLIRGKSVPDKFASATPATFATLDSERGRTVATVTIASSPSGQPARAWLLHFTDRDPLEVWFAPPATHAVVMADYPSAIAAEPSTPNTRCAVIRMTADEERTVRAWLQRIEETDPATIAGVIDQCQRDADARDYFTGRSAEPPKPDPLPDDRRTCQQCANLIARQCQAARRGEIATSRHYEPIRDLVQRCEGYAPGAEDPDRRHGRERWPGLIQKGSK